VNIASISAATNLITTIPPIQPWMTTITLNSNPLTNIDAIYSINATQLRSMNFYSCGIIAPLPSTFSIWPSLQTLTWGNNKFYGYLNETAFNNNPLIRTIDLSYNGLVCFYVIPISFLSHSYLLMKQFRFFSNHISIHYIILILI
jgi:hypothetical protein